MLPYGDAALIRDKMFDFKYDVSKLNDNLIQFLQETKLLYCVGFTRVKVEFNSKSILNHRVCPEQILNL